MKRSIFFKILSGYVLITLLLAGFFLLSSFAIIRNHYLATLTGDLESFSVALAARVTPLLEQKEPAGLETFLQDTAARTARRITVIDTGGNVLADSEGDPRSMENHRTRPEIVTALKGRTGTSLRLSATVNQEMLYVAVPLVRDGKVFAVLRSSLFIHHINRLLSGLQISLLHITAIIILLSLIVAYLLARGLSRPIRTLNEAAHTIASGDFSAKVSLRRRDELKDLAESFNHMTEQIGASFARISHQKEELDAILSALQEGIAVIDAGEKVVHSNDRFRKIVRHESAENRYYWEIIREPKLIEAIKRASRDVLPVCGEIEPENRHYLFSITPIASRREIVVALHDVTDVKNLEKMKKDFVTNVSHELRTPLTAIKGFLETLDDEDAEQNRRYIGIIQRHTERLIAVVEDLLLLSRLEEKGFSLEKAAVNLAELLHNVLSLFEKRFKERDLKLQCDIPDTVPALQADAFKLQQAFVNLIDNAIKYTEKGWVRVSVSPGPKEVSIAIEDSGIGIPQEHLGRIFERFYVADKSRSRKLGGTGLGLSIVKHIVLLHSGTIHVGSTPGAGTKFTITLPLH